MFPRTNRNRSVLQPWGPVMVFSPCEALKLVMGCSADEDVKKIKVRLCWWSWWEEQPVDSCHIKTKIKNFEWCREGESGDTEKTNVRSKRLEKCKKNKRREERLWRGEGRSLGCQIILQSPLVLSTPVRTYGSLSYRLILWRHGLGTKINPPHTPLLTFSEPWQEAGRM